MISFLNQYFSKVSCRKCVAQIYFVPFTHLCYTMMTQNEDECGRVLPPAGRQLPLSVAKRWLKVTQVRIYSDGQLRKCKSGLKAVKFLVIYSQQISPLICQYDMGSQKRTED